MTTAFAPIVSTLAMLSILAAWSLMNGAPRSGSDLADPTVLCDLDPPRDIGGIEACVARAPRDVELLLELGAAFEARGNLPDAEAAYRRAVAADPRDAEVRLRLATALRRAGDVDGARREGAVALGLRPNDPMASALASAEAGVAPDPQ